jgi:hypothetical protein
MKVGAQVRHGHATDAKLYRIDLPPEILVRGFWLYAWKLVDPGNENFCYVGMTGDVTGVAQSPYQRPASAAS